MRKLQGRGDPAKRTPAAAIAIGFIWIIERCGNYLTLNL